MAVIHRSWRGAGKRRKHFRETWKPWRSGFLVFGNDDADALAKVPVLLVSLSPGGFLLAVEFPIRAGWQGYVVRVEQMAYPGSRHLGVVADDGTPLQNIRVAIQGMRSPGAERLTLYCRRSLRLAAGRDDTLSEAVYSFPLRLKGLECLP